MPSFASSSRRPDTVTYSERPPNPAMYPDCRSRTAGAGCSLVFVKPDRPVSLRNNHAWWEYRPGANWRHPQGRGSSIAGRDDHPVVHIAHEDALAYAAWCGKELPTEAEWEFAARGGLEGKAYPWGDAANPEGRFLANTWQGQFPHENLAEDGYDGTSPVDAFPANGYGLFDMVGNVWEWTSSPYDAVPDQPGAILLPSECRRRPIHAPRGEGRLASLRPELLPALSAVGPSGRNGRFFHLSHRLSLRRASTRRAADAGQPPAPNEPSHIPDRSNANVQLRRQPIAVRRLAIHLGSAASRRTSLSENLWPASSRRWR